MKKIPVGFILLTFLCVIALTVRLYKFDNSIAEWFSWRQSDTAAVARFLISDNFNLLKPRYYDLSNIQSGMDNPQGLRMVEFPLYNAAFALLFKLWPVIAIEQWGRVIAIVCSLIVLAVLYKLLEHEFGKVEAFFGGLFFALAPYVVFYSRVVLPDMPAVSLAMIGVYSMYRYSLSKNKLFFCVSILFYALALLVKPTTIYFGLIIIYLLIHDKYSSWIKPVGIVVLFIGISTLPVWLWRNYIKAFPEGIAASQWLLTSVNTPKGLETIFFRPAFFRWVFYERISNLILGGYGIVLLILGMFTTGKQKLYLPGIFLLSALLYLFTFQGGNVQHDYYQIMIIPAMTLLVGAGAGLIMRQKKWSFYVVRLGTVFLLLTISFLFSFYQIKGNYVQSDDVLLSADVIRSLTGKDDIIVTDTMGDTTLLYLSDRRGFPAPYKEFPLLKAQGAKYFMTLNTDYRRSLKDKYELVFDNDHVLLFAL